MSLYIPSTNYPCIVVQNHDTIRAYHTTPTLNSTTQYTDYFVNSHYMKQEGSTTWNQYSTLPSCNVETFTDNVYYRNDFDSILIIFFIILLVCFYFPYRIISRMFGRWLKW